MNDASGGGLPGTSRPGHVLAHHRVGRRGAIAVVLLQRTAGTPTASTRRPDNIAKTGGGINTATDAVLKLDRPTSWRLDPRHGQAARGSAGRDHRPGQVHRRPGHLDQRHRRRHQQHGQGHQRHGGHDPGHRPVHQRRRRPDQHQHRHHARLWPRHQGRHRQHPRRRPHGRPARLLHRQRACSAVRLTGVC